MEIELETEASSRPAAPTEPGYFNPRFSAAGFQIRTAGRSRSMSSSYFNPLDSGMGLQTTTSQLTDQTAPWAILTFTAEGWAQPRSVCQASAQTAPCETGGVYIDLKSIVCTSKS
jgi:hypothetical protein